MGAVIARGAEAILEKEGATLAKTRPKKGYRAPALDRWLRARRTRLEAKAIAKAAEAGVNVPKIISSDDGKAEIQMDFLEGPTLKSAFSPELMPAVAEQVALLHAAGIIHGDLTTSNIVLAAGRVSLIDFGLAKFSRSTEDRAVDIHLFRQALESTHTAQAEEAFRLFLESYGRKFPEVAARLKKVESRGRYRSRA